MDNQDKEEVCLKTKKKYNTTEEDEIEKRYECNNGTSIRQRLLSNFAHNQCRADRMRTPSETTSSKRRRCERSFENEILKVGMKRRLQLLDGEDGSTDLHDHQKRPTSVRDLADAQKRRGGEFSDDEMISTAIFSPHMLCLHWTIK